MLQSIRDRTQGWIAGIIISLLIISFALWGIHSYFIGGSTNTTVAEVNGVEISKGQLTVAYERLRRQLQSQLETGNEIPANVDVDLKQNALQALINVQVLKQASLKQDYYISQSQVDGYLENMPEFQVNGQFSVARFQQALASTMYTSGEFLDLIKTSLLIDQPKLGMIFSSFALPNEATDMIALVNQERDIEYVVLSFQNFAKQLVTIPENKVQAYYEQHLNEFKTPEQVSVNYLELSVKDLMSRVNSTEDELKNFYNENPNMFAQPVQWQLDTLLIPASKSLTVQEENQITNKANEVLDKAKNGVEFRILAKEYSLNYKDDKSKWVTQSQVPADLQKTLLSLTSVGQIAGPVKVDDGFIIVKAQNFKQPELMPFEKVKDQVKQVYTRQKAEEMFSDMREKLASVTYEHPDSLQAASNELKLPILSSELFSKEKGQGFSSNSKIREAAFSDDVLNSQNNSDVIAQGSDVAVVLRIKSRVPASLLSLKAVQQQITDQLISNEIDVRTLQYANEIKEKLANSVDVSQVLKSYNISWIQAGFIQRHSTGVDSAILDTAFEMPKPKNGKFTYAIAKLANGYAIVGLKEIKMGKLASSEEEDVYAEQLQNSQGLLEYELYKQSLISKAKIAISK